MKGFSQSQGIQCIHVSLQIAKVYENQKPLDLAPWHADGGDWTFFDCHPPKQPLITIVVGSHTKVTDKNASTTGIPVSWGEARLAVNDSAAGAQFVEAFAKAFHTPSPPVRSNNPTGLLKMPTAALGTGLIRDSAGGFKDGRNGTWSANKWFLQEDTAETEVFFNFSLSDIPQVFRKGHGLPRGPRSTACSRASGWPAARTDARK